jgi:hypothetical protein
MMPGPGFPSAALVEHDVIRFFISRQYFHQALQVTVAGLALASAVGCDYGRGAPADVVFPRVDNVSYLGCVEVGPRESSRVLLWTLDDPSGSERVGRVSGTGQSTSANGAWLGTTQLELEGDQVGEIATHHGHRVRVTGTLEEQGGSSGKVDQLQMSEGAVFRRLRPSHFELVEGTCAFDPRRREPAAQASEHP